MRQEPIVQRGECGDLALLFDQVVNCAETLLTEAGLLGNGVVERLVPKLGAPVVPAALKIYVGVQVCAELPTRHVLLAAEQLGRVPLQVFDSPLVELVRVLQSVGQPAPGLMRPFQSGKQ